LSLRFAASPAQSKRYANKHEYYRSEAGKIKKRNLNARRSQAIISSFGAIRIHRKPLWRSSRSLGSRNCATSAGGHQTHRMPCNYMTFKFSVSSEFHGCILD